MVTHERHGGASVSTASTSADLEARLTAAHDCAAVLVFNLAALLADTKGMLRADAERVSARVGDLCQRRAQPWLCRAKTLAGMLSGDCRPCRRKAAHRG